MEFQAKLVQKNKNPKARLAWAGGALIFVGMLLMCIDGCQRFGLFVFGAAIVVLIWGAIKSKGDVDFIAVSDTTLVVSTEEIRIGDKAYRVNEVSELLFQVEGYAGMRDPEGYSRDAIGGSAQFGHRIALLNGTNNWLNFKVGGEKQEWQFYLPDPQHVQQLGLVFKELYSRRVPFKERSVTSHRTFLFQPVSEGQWRDLMIENGYM